MVEVSHVLTLIVRLSLNWNLNCTCLTAYLDGIGRNWLRISNAAYFYLNLILYSDQQFRIFAFKIVVAFKFVVFVVFK